MGIRLAVNNAPTPRARPANGARPPDRACFKISFSHHVSAQDESCFLEFLFPFLGESAPAEEPRSHYLWNLKVKEKDAVEQLTLLERDGALTWSAVAG